MCMSLYIFDAYVCVYVCLCVCSTYSCTLILEPLCVDMFSSGLSDCRKQWINM